jgi:hypothetical protein
MFWTSLGHRGRPCLKREEDRKEGGLRSCYIPEVTTCHTDRNPGTDRTAGKTTAT